jgi:hypothetical protein
MLKNNDIRGYWLESRCGPTTFMGLERVHQGACSGLVTSIVRLHNYHMTAELDITIFGPIIE